MRTLTMTNLGRNGRLGNQLFQLAGLIGLGEKHGMRAVFPEWKYAKFFHPGTIEFGRVRGTKIRERHFHHHEWTFPSKGDLDVSGFFQSEKYFPSKEVFRFRSGFIRVIRERYEEMLSNRPLAIHLRRGDYVGNPNYVNLHPGWHISAMLQHFPDWESRNILVFSDDMDYAKVHFGCLPNARFPDGRDIECLALMSLCDDLIISNSSYGWWAAYFAEKHGAKIVRPSKHLDGRLASTCDEKDLYPDRWISHDVKSRIDLSDCAFTIPVSYDHNDRLENMDICLRALQRDIVAPVIIMEHGKRKRFEKFSGYESVALYLRFEEKAFHRTRMLNQMARATSLPFVANWDCDVIVPPMQIFLAVKFLRDGGDMVFPYAGKFARMERKPWAKTLSHVPDIGQVGKSVFHGMTEGFVSVGGAVLFNRRKFLAYGGENETFISYGSEDVERDERFQRLGFAKHRVQGCLYHLNHYVGFNSCQKNPFFKANDKELARIRALTDEQLHKEFLCEDLTSL